jgi:hypothetical protein
MTHDAYYHWMYFAVHLASVLAGRASGICFSIWFLRKMKLDTLLAVSIGLGVGAILSWLALLFVPGSP